MKVNQQKMTSGDDRQRGLIKNIFGRCSKKVAVSRPACTKGTSSSQSATQSQPSPPIPTPASSSPQFYPSKEPTHKIRDIIRSRYDAPYISWKKVLKEVQDIWFREFEGVWAELSSAWGSPDYTRRRDQNRQNRASDVGGLGSSLYIGGSVPRTKHRRHLKQMLGREPTPVELHSHTHKQQEDQQWVVECARRAYEEYTRLRESQVAVGEGSSTGSTDYSDYRTWSQAVGGMQHDRVYGLGSQAYAYEGQTSIGGINVEITFQSEEGLFFLLQVSSGLFVGICVRNKI
ncbi:hypothetical protein IEQ34_002904 [Dendrobium chrysotoxum]|uniref:Uncharacterized protein n=1 Tax=Dendrobium chrysotoxum TaxID=161865 RepID=A0AAV7HH39_DENCH|nr:hypothetical protein IEQ34_002904 [Dendrobium chrysotoxum]